MLQLFARGSHAQDPMRGPWDSPEHARRRTSHAAESGTGFGQSRALVTPGGLIALAALVAYQAVLSPTKGRSCPMHPSCSAFAVQSVREYGALQGALMAADRLHRCGHDLTHYRKHVIRGDMLHIDPPEASAPQTYETTHDSIPSPASSRH